MFDLTSRISLILVLTAIVVDRAHAQDADPGHYVSPWKTAWAYEGPRGPGHWGELDPGYALCNSGSAQSPIDIAQTEVTDLPALEFENRSGQLKHVINNGYTIRVNYYAPGSGDFLVVGGTRYQLFQFHFHRPAEELIHGRSYPMVAHLMYQSTEGKVAGVAVFLTAGRANTTVQRLWDHMPAHEGQADVSGIDLDPGGLLPSDRGYYAYEGSISAPPCMEGVTWFVLRTPMEISAGQIAVFAALFPNDARPVQPLNGRIVKESR